MTFTFQMSAKIIVKTKEQDEYCHGLCASIFAVEKKEWEEFGKHIDRKTTTHQRGPDDCEHEINLYELYSTAQTFEADENTIAFLSTNGIDNALKCLRRGTRVSRNKERLHEIFDKLALFREIEKCKDASFDSVSFSKTGYYGIEQDETVLAWKLPTCPEEVSACKEFNEKLLEEALKRHSRSFGLILNAKKFWCHTTLLGVFVRIYIPDDVCLWDHDVNIAIDHNVNPCGVKYPDIHIQRRINFKSFVRDVLPSFQGEFYRFFNCPGTDVPHTYCAVVDGKRSGIYKCAKGDDAELWKKDGKDVFPNFEGAVYFSLDSPLRIGEQIIAVSLEFFKPDFKKDHELELEQAAFTDIRYANAWVLRKIKSYCGETTDIDIPEYDLLWMDEIEVNGWTFCITKIEGSVKSDPRKSEPPPKKVNFKRMMEVIKNH